jgi:hypothetical protein
MFRVFREEQRQWTVPVHLFDQRPDTPKIQEKSLAQTAGNTLRIGPDYSAPHHYGFLTRGERLVDGPPSELPEDLVIGDAPRIA